MCVVIYKTKKEISGNFLWETAETAKYVAHVLGVAVSKEFNSLL